MPPKQKGTKRAAAAAAAASDDDGQSHAADDKRQKTDSDAAPAAAPAAVPLSDAPICPVCWEAYKCEEAKADCDSLIPRTLPCTHSACSGCLLKLITATPGCVKCPTCRDDRPVQLPAGIAAAAVSTPAAWLRCIPQSSTIIESIRRSQQLEAQLRVAQSQQQRCSYPACAAAAVQWCEECDSEMCAAHDASTHARHLSGHKRVLLADKQAEQQQRLQSVRASAGAELKRDVAAAVDRLAQASHEADMDRLLQAARRPPVAAAAGTSLLDSLSNEEFGQLVRFLHKSGVGMFLPVLLYRASRDGFKRDDFVRCCANKGSTLTLVKVKDNGFIFGAYTHCSWPAANGVVADPTGKSFLFSLINASGKPVRFSLRDKNRAIRLTDRVCFGAWECEGGKPPGCPNVILMYNDAADQKDANTSNHTKFHKTPYQADDDDACDASFLAGRQRFAAEQIEVYQL